MHPTQFLEYFEKMWVSEESSTNKWHYYNCEANVFTTNNICESLNASIKRDYTNRERKPLHQFMKVLKDIFIDIFNEKNKNKFETSINISNKMKADATVVAEKKLFVAKNDFYFIAKDLKTKIKTKDIEKLINLNFTSLEDFQQVIYRIVTLKWDQNTKKATCFCHEGFTYGKCIHKCALEILNGSLNKLVQLKANKKRGVKRKNPKALIMEVQQISAKRVKRSIR